MIVVIKFPFLIGRIRTFYEYYRNIHYHQLFPFLIGRIRTLYKKKQLSKYFAFPFLIGRIRTDFFCSCDFVLYLCVSIPHRQDKNYREILGTYVSEEQFPFLIGRIRTLQHHLLYCLSHLVSIPHRQDKNRSFNKKQNRYRSVSIPHRQDKNSNIPDTSNPDYTSFHSSQVG